MLLHEMIINAKQLYPEKIAVESNESSITFEGLDRASTSLASYLLKQGIQKNDKTAVLLNKSIEMIAAFLGVLKSGACYIPIDTSAPNERISYILRDAQVNYIITDDKHIEQAFAVKKEKMQIVLISDEPKDEKRNSIYVFDFLGAIKDKENSYPVPCIDIKEDDLAYILYTSGSTGEPKGVALSHKNAVCFVNWAYEYFGVTNQDILSSHAPFYFDLSVFDIYVSIKAGAKLCLLPPAVSAFPASLVSYVEEKKITVWYSVPSVIVQLFRYGNLEKGKLGRLRIIIYAGEAFPVLPLKSLMHILPNANFFNLYGPTETNVITYYPIKLSDCNEEIPIGYACPYAKLWVITEEGYIAKTGEKGELIVQSESLMKGYINKDEVTKKVIKEVKVDGLPNGVYYHTGDIVKVVDEGQYQFVCRKDHMVKIKGFRVELEEIESVLRKHPLIKECLVKQIVDEKIDPFLRAYVISDISPKEIIRFVKKYLPEYMIPYDIRYVQEFTYTDRGKINRYIKNEKMEQGKEIANME